MIPLEDHSVTTEEIRPRPRLRRNNLRRQIEAPIKPLIFPNFDIVFPPGPLRGETLPTPRGICHSLSRYDPITPGKVWFLPAGSFSTSLFDQVWEGFLVKASWFSGICFRFGGFFKNIIYDSKIKSWIKRLN